jgi:hypothetical protein
MMIRDEHVRLLAAQRQQDALNSVRRSQILAARRSRRQAEESSRWIRRLLVAVR